MTKARIAISTSSFAALDATPLQMLALAGVEAVPNPYGRRLTESEAIGHLKDVDGLLAGVEPLTRRVLESAPTLRAIARVGIGMANVDLEAAREQGIKVSNTPKGPTTAVAEMTVTALLALCRNLVPTNAALHAGRWQKSIGMGLEGLKVLSIGYGRIGRRVHDLLKGFGTIALVYDPYLDSATLKQGETQVSLAEGLPQADVITIHAAGNQTILRPDEFAQIQNGALLLNSARGELVDEGALIDALESGKIKSAWLDVFREEPYSGKLLEYDQVLLTPHVATYTRQCRLSMETAAVRNVLRDLEISTEP